MAAYALRRLLWLIPVMLGVSLVTFVLMHNVPGGPWDSDKLLPQQTIDRLNREYGLDDPLPVQYGRYLGNLFKGDLGPSFRQERSVNEVLADGLPRTALLGAIAFTFALVTGLTLGALAALHKNSLVDHASVLFATAGASLPSFIIGSLLILLLSVQLGWLPVLGWGSPEHVVMPALSLGLLPAAYIARITRASMLEVLNEDYIRAARAKGLRERTIAVRHVMRNAMIPVLTVAGPIAAALVTGSFIIERLFGIPGIGREFVDSVFRRDYGVIMGVTLFYALVVALANLAVDLLYAVADPRIRYGR